MDIGTIHIGGTMYRLRIMTNRTTDTRWIIGGTRYSKIRTEQRAEQLRRQGHVVHVDLAEWHR